MDKENVNKIVAGILCVALAYFGFEYDSGWAFLGSFFAFLTAID